MNVRTLVMEQEIAKLKKENAMLRNAKKTGWYNYYRLYDTLEEKTRAYHKLITQMEGLNELDLPAYITNLIHENKKTFECPICHEDLETSAKDKYLVTLCGHFFCRECFNSWTKDNYTCPTCRKIVKKR